MPRFELWAPRPQLVELVLEGRRHPMERRPGGWWWAPVDHAPAGARYGFSLDGRPPIPDPRSRHQPDGIEGLSAVVDPEAFGWTDDAWPGVGLPGSVLYELHVGTFSAPGTFEGVIEHLPHLVDLGVDAIEMMPVAEFSGDRGWGYDGVGLFAPHHAYGGPEGLDRLVDACHAVGLGVVMDVVYNHLGPAGNHLPELGPYLTERHHTVWGDAVNFDGPGADEVRRFVIDNALMWLRDHHCDGLRLDAVHAIVDQSALPIVEELAVEVDALSERLGRRLLLIAENDTNDPRLVRSRDVGGYGLDAAWADDWHHAVHVALTGQTSGYYQDYADWPPALVKALRQGWVHDRTWSPSRDRTHGRPPEGLEPHQLVVCTQNHDQVGNRAQGERSAALMSEGRLHVGAALLLTSPFTPLLFQGEEWAASTPFQYFTDHQEAGLAQAVREGRRHEFAAFGWAPEDVPDPQAPATFERSRLDWSELAEPQHRALLDWYRQLIALRRHQPAITDPHLATEAVFDDDAGVLRVSRGPVHLAANLGPTAEAIDLAGDSTLLLASPGVTVPSAAASPPVEGGRLSPTAGAEGPAPRRGVVLAVDSVVIWHEPGG